MSILEQREFLDEDEIYFNFINSLKSETTKKIYDKNVKHFMRFCKVNKYSGLLALDAQSVIVNI